MRGRKTVVLDHQMLRDADFSGGKLEFSSAGSTLERCRFDHSRIRDAAFGAGRETSEYIDCTFDESWIRFGMGGFSRFVRCSFRDVDLRDWFCFCVELIECTFSGKLEGAFFNGTVPEEKRSIIGRRHNEFHGNDLSALTLIDVGFRTGIDLTVQRLPSGPEYLYVADAAEAVGRARADVVAWTDLDLRQPALVLIKNLEEDIAAGQRELFIRPADAYPVLGVGPVDAVVTLLREE